MPENEPATAPHADEYRRLAAPFDETMKDTRGGVEITYITGEQCASRLNEVLGVSGWSFRVVEHGFHPEADEAWVLGEMLATFGERTVMRQQFGSQKVKRSRASSTPLDIGFDLKGAGTDAMKKCASLLGVGLYLSHKEQGGQAARPAAAVRPAAQPATNGRAPAPAAAAASGDLMADWQAWQTELAQARVVLGTEPKTKLDRNATAAQITLARRKLGDEVAAHQRQVTF